MLSVISFHIEDHGIDNSRNIWQLLGISKNLGIFGPRALDLREYHPDKTCKGYPYILRCCDKRPAIENLVLTSLVGRFNFSSTIYSEKCCLFFRHFSLKKWCKFQSFFTPFQHSFEFFTSNRKSGENVLSFPLSFQLKN
jgi:hypothetical protein